MNRLHWYPSDAYYAGRLAKKHRLVKSYNNPFEPWQEEYVEWMKGAGLL